MPENMSDLSGIVVTVLDFKVESLRFSPWPGHGDCRLENDTLSLFIQEMYQHYLWEANL